MANISVALSTNKQPIPAGVTPGGIQVRLLAPDGTTDAQPPVVVQDPTVPVVFSAVPGGTYTVSAAAVGADGTLWSTPVTQAVTVAMPLSDVPVSLVVTVS